VHNLVNEYKTILLCLQCGEETEHEVTYFKDLIQSVRCTKCGYKVDINRKWLEEVFSENFIDRIFSAPHQMTDAMKKAVALILPFVPKRLISEPYKVAKEILDILTRDK